MRNAAAPPVFFFGRRSAAPMLFGDVEMTPQSLLLLLHWRSFGYVWNWPIAVNVVRNGRTQRHRIVDVTRLGQWGLALILCLALGMFSAHRSSHRSSQRSK